MVSSTDFAPGARTGGPQAIVEQTMSSDESAFTALQVGEVLDAGLGDQTVDRVVEFRRDRDRVRSGERLADQKRRGDMGDVDGAVMQRVDHLVGAARQRDDDLKVQTLALEKSLALRHHDRQRVNTANGRIGLAIAQRQRLGAGLRAKRGKSQSHDNTPHQSVFFSVQSTSIGAFSALAGARRVVPVCW